MSLFRLPTREELPDAVLLVTAITLLAIGLLMVTSASITLADRHYGNAFHFLQRQVFAVGLGLGAAWFMLWMPLIFWQKLGMVLALSALLLLLLVLVPGLGNEVNGSRRWLSIGGVSVMQVSEPARLLMLMYIASYAVRRNAEVRSTLGGYFWPLAPVFMGVLLLLAQPDFGSAVLLLAISIAVLFIAGAQLRYLIPTMLVLPVGLLIVARAAPYRLARITGFTDPWADPFGSGFQLTQSLIAIGTGQWTGLGLGGSVQKLFYLPEAHTDFIFAVIAEELGLVGSLLMILLYGLLVWRALAISNLAAARGQKFAAYLAFGLGIWLGLQAAINLGVNMGILPTKGLTLPLVSYGRSSLIITLAALGLLLRIDLEARGVVSTTLRGRSRGQPKGRGGRGRDRKGSR